jgi:hypothetical protein
MRRIHGFRRTLQYAIVWNRAAVYRGFPVLRGRRQHRHFPPTSTRGYSAWTLLPPDNGGTCS